MHVPVNGMEQSGTAQPHALPISAMPEKWHYIATEEGIRIRQDASHPPAGILVYNMMMSSANCPWIGASNKTEIFR